MKKKEETTTVIDWGSERWQCRYCDHTFGGRATRPRVCPRCKRRFVEHEIGPFPSRCKTCARCMTIAISRNITERRAGRLHRLFDLPATRKRLACLVRPEILEALTVADYDGGWPRVFECSHHEERE